MGKINAKELLYVFAHYGYQKTSMSNLAEKAELSRQALYNRFGSKDAIFDFVVKEYVQDLYELAIRSLNEPSLPPKDAIIEAYTLWAGSSIPLIHGTPHGAELFDKAIQSHQKMSLEIEDRFKEEVISFMKSNDLISGNADDIAFVLSMATKGLLLKTLSIDDFRNGVGRVLNVIS